MVRDLNAESESNVAAYSIDAGFHVFVFCLKQNLALVKRRLQTTKVIKDNLEKVIETSIDPHGIEP